MWTRRVFLKSGGIALFGLGAGPRFLVRTALAAAPAARRRVLVTVFQRGAMDGLAAVAPVAAPLAELRPRLTVSAARAAGQDRAIDLGVGYALHPALAPLVPLW